MIVGEDVAAAERFARALHAVGLWCVEGVAAGDPAAWRAAGCALAATPAWRVDELAGALRCERRDAVDVRDRNEYEAGHVPGSLNVPLSVLGDGRDGVPAQQGRLAVACAMGPRAALGASLLRRAGHRDVVHVAGGGIPDLPAHRRGARDRSDGVRDGGLMRAQARPRAAHVAALRVARSRSPTSPMPRR